MPECSRWVIGASLKDDKVTGQAKRGEKKYSGEKNGRQFKKADWTGNLCFARVSWKERKDF